VESVKVITIVQVESPEVVVLVVGGREGHGVGGNGGPGRSESTLEADRVDLGFTDRVHSDDLVSEEVVADSISHGL
jgi:hypothetical protein